MITRRKALRSYRIGGRHGRSSLTTLPALAQNASAQDLAVPGPARRRRSGPARRQGDDRRIRFAHLLRIARPSTTDTYPELKKRYIDTGKVRFILREFPLDPLATAGFMLARCDGEQNTTRSSTCVLRSSGPGPITDKPLDALRQMMRQAGFSQEKFDSCLKDQKLYDAVNAVKEPAHRHLQGRIRRRPSSSTASATRATCRSMSSRRSSSRCWRSEARGSIASPRLRGEGFGRRPKRNAAKRSRGEGAVQEGALPATRRLYAAAPSPSPSAQACYLRKPGVPGLRTKERTLGGPEVRQPSLRKRGYGIHTSGDWAFCAPPPLRGRAGRGVGADGTRRAPVPFGRRHTPLSNSPPQGGRGPVALPALVLQGRCWRVSASPTCVNPVGLRGQAVGARRAIGGAA